MTPPLTPDHLAELRRLAEAARVDEAERAGGSGWYRAEFFHAIIDSDDAPLMEDADAAYIAAVSPDVVLSLLEAARREARVRTALEPFREQAETWLRMVTDTANNTYPMREDTTLKDGHTVGDWVRLARALQEGTP